MQDEVIAFLAEPATHGLRPQAVELIETHAALIFLAGETAYKIKRAVTLGYLDFSSLEKRRAACEREIDVNVKTAPEIYDRVVPIVRQSDGRLAIGGEDGKNGDVVEWVVRMRRFDNAFRLDRVMARGEVSDGQILALADGVAEMHRSAEIKCGRDGAQIMTHVWNSVIAALEAGEALGAPEQVRDLGHAASARLMINAGLLRERADNGYVRRCHGDLHMANVVVLEGKPTPFDAIEFDEDIASVDILYDLAFMEMDLWQHGEQRAANLLLNRYLQTSDDGANLDGLAALPLFMACRAGVRAMVALDRLPHAGESAHAGILSEARDYLGLSLRFLAPRTARLVAVGGLSGTGKSTLATELAPQIGAAPGALHVRSDVERKLMWGCDPLTRLPADAYTQQTSDNVYERMRQKARRALAAGHSVLVDAVHARLHEREALERIAHDLGVPFAGIWLDGARDILEERVAARKGDASDADTAVLADQLTYDTGPVAWRRIDAGGPVDKVAAAAVDAIGL